MSTDIIVGFPGETDADFEDTLELVAHARWDSAFTFQFSARPGTAAAEYSDDFVPQELITERYGRLTELQDRITAERHQEDVGKRLDVLVDGPSRRDATWPRLALEAANSFTSQESCRRARSGRPILSLPRAGISWVNSPAPARGEA